MATPRTFYAIKYPGHIINNDKALESLGGLSNVEARLNNFFRNKVQYRQSVDSLGFSFLLLACFVVLFLCMAVEYGVSIVYHRLRPPILLA